MLKWYRESKQVQEITEILNYIFTLIFVSEAIIRIGSQSFLLYIKDPWNLFDFIVALGSVLGVVVTLSSNLAFKGVSLLRAFRILRLLRLLKRGGKSMYLIFNTFVITMQS